MNTFLEPGRRDLLGFAVGVHPLRQRTVTAEHLVQTRVGGAVALGVASADLDVEVVANLLDEPDVITRELACGAVQSAQMGADETGPLLGEPRTAGDARKCGQQPPGLGRQLGRLRRRFARDHSAQPVVAGEGVDVAVLDAVEPQTEQEVFTNQVVGLHGFHANCKT